MRFKSWECMTDEEKVVQVRREVEMKMADGIKQQGRYREMNMLLTEKERFSWIATLLSRGSEGDWRVRMSIALALGDSEEFLKWILMQEEVK